MRRVITIASLILLVFGCTRPQRNSSDGAQDRAQAPVASSLPVVSTKHLDRAPIEIEKLVDEDPEHVGFISKLEMKGIVDGKDYNLLEKLEKSRYLPDYFQFEGGLVFVSPLLFAVQNDDKEMVKFLIDRGSATELFIDGSAEEVSIFSVAFSLNNFQMAKYLHSLGVQFHIESGFGILEGDDLTKFRFLVDQGILDPTSLLSLRENGMVPGKKNALSSIFRSDWYEIQNYLLDLDLDLNAVCSEYPTASEIKRYTLLDTLEEKIAQDEESEKDKRYETWYPKRSVSREREIAQKLIKRGGKRYKDLNSG